MGETQSAVTNNPKTNNKDKKEHFLSSFHKVKVYQDERYGKLVIYKKKLPPENIVIVKELWTSDQQAEADTMLEINLLGHLNHENLLEFIGHHRKRENSFCSSFSKHYCAFRFPTRTLKKEIEFLRGGAEKHKSGAGEVGAGRDDEIFPESEIWYLITSLTSALDILHKNNMPHGDIQPRTVHLTKSGEIKIANNHFFSQGCSGYKKMVHSNLDYKAALSPRLVQALNPAKAKKISIRGISDDGNIAHDVWSVGLTVLCACCRMDFRQFYDFKSFKIDFEGIKRCLAMLSGWGYSQHLVHLLGRMLHPEEGSRIGFERLREMVELVGSGKRGKTPPTKNGRKPVKNGKERSRSRKKGAREVGGPRGRQDNTLDMKLVAKNRLKDLDKKRASLVDRSSLEGRRGTRGPRDESRYESPCVMAHNMTPERTYYCKQPKILPVKKMGVSEFGRGKENQSYYSNNNQGERYARNHANDVEMAQNKGNQNIANQLGLSGSRGINHDKKHPGGGLGMNHGLVASELAQNGLNSGNRGKSQFDQNLGRREHGAFIDPFNAPRRCLSHNLSNRRYTVMLTKSKIDNPAVFEVKRNKSLTFHPGTKKSALPAKRRHRSKPRDVQGLRKPQKSQNFEKLNFPQSRSISPGGATRGQFDKPMRNRSRERLRLIDKQAKSGPKNENLDPYFKSTKKVIKAHKSKSRPKNGPPGGRRAPFERRFGEKTDKYQNRAISRNTHSEKIWSSYRGTLDPNSSKPSHMQQIDSFVSLPKPFNQPNPHFDKNWQGRSNPPSRSPLNDWGRQEAPQGWIKASAPPSFSHHPPQIAQNRQIQNFHREVEFCQKNGNRVVPRAKPWLQDSHMVQIPAGSSQTITQRTQKRSLSPYQNQPEKTIRQERLTPPWAQQLDQSFFESSYLTNQPKKSPKISENQSHVYGPKPLKTASKLHSGVPESVSESKETPKNQKLAGELYSEKQQIPAPNTHPGMHQTPESNPEGHLTTKSFSIKHSEAEIQNRQKMAKNPKKLKNRPFQHLNSYKHLPTASVITSQFNKSRTTLQTTQTGKTGLPAHQAPGGACTPQVISQESYRVLVRGLGSGEIHSNSLKLRSSRNTSPTPYPGRRSTEYRTVTTGGSDGPGTTNFMSKKTQISTPPYVNDFSNECSSVKVGGVQGLGSGLARTNRGLCTEFFNYDDRLRQELLLGGSDGFGGESKESDERNGVRDGVGGLAGPSEQKFCTKNGQNGENFGENVEEISIERFDAVQETPVAQRSPKFGELANSARNNPKTHYVETESVFGGKSSKELLQATQPRTRMPKYAEEGKKIQNIDQKGKILGNSSRLIRNSSQPKKPANEGQLDKPKARESQKAQFGAALGRNDPKTQNSQNRDLGPKSQDLLSASILGGYQVPERQSEGLQNDLEIQKQFLMNELKTPKRLPWLKESMISRAESKDSHTSPTSGKDYLNKEDSGSGSPTKTQKFEKIAISPNKQIGRDEDDLRQRNAYRSVSGNHGEREGAQDISKLSAHPKKAFIYDSICIEPDQPSEPKEASQDHKSDTEARSKDGERSCIENSEVIDQKVEIDLPTNLSSKGSPEPVQGKNHIENQSPSTFPSPWRLKNGKEVEKSEKELSEGSFRKKARIEALMVISSQQETQRASSPEFYQENNQYLDLGQKRRTKASLPSARNQGSSFAKSNQKRLSEPLPLPRSTLRQPGVDQMAGFSHPDSGPKQFDDCTIGLIESALAFDKIGKSRSSQPQQEKKVYIVHNGKLYCVSEVGQNGDDMGGSQRLKPVNGSVRGPRSAREPYFESDGPENSSKRSEIVRAKNYQNRQNMRIEDVSREVNGPERSNIGSETQIYSGFSSRTNIAQKFDYSDFGSKEVSERHMNQFYNYDCSMQSHQRDTGSKKTWLRSENGKIGSESILTSKKGFRGLGADRGEPHHGGETWAQFSSLENSRNHHGEGRGPQSENRKSRRGRGEENQKEYSFLNSSSNNSHQMIEETHLNHLKR